MTMDQIMADFGKMKKIVDDSLDHLTSNDEPLVDALVESVRYTLFSGGKRIRPIFCFIVGEMFDVPMEKLKATACALEMIHTASLIMDDLPHMDNSPTRRGKPSNHMVYGQDVASLASIGLLTKAYEVVLSDDSIRPDKKVLVVEKLANTVGINGLVGGQFVDLKFARGEIDKSAIDFIHTHKTASLFVASGTVAAIIGNADSKQIKAIESYADHLGFAFQILDDLLDVVGNENDVGKTLQSDNNNYVILHGVEESKKRLKQYADKALDAVSIFGNKNVKLVTLCQMLLQRKS